jgi:hypothetical protein
MLRLNESLFSSVSRPTAITLWPGSMYSEVYLGTLFYLSGRVSLYSRVYLGLLLYRSGRVSTVCIQGFAHCCTQDG